MALEGSGLAPEARFVQSDPLPTAMLGTSDGIAGSDGAARETGLKLVALGRISFIVPANTPTGTASVSVSVPGAASETVELTVVSTAPGLFSANWSGAGAAAAEILRIASDGSETRDPGFRAGSRGGFLRGRGAGLGKCRGRGIHDSVRDRDPPGNRSKHASRGRDRFDSGGRTATRGSRCRPGRSGALAEESDWPGRGHCHSHGRRRAIKRGHPGVPVVARRPDTRKGLPLRAERKGIGARSGFPSAEAGCENRQETSRALTPDRQRASRQAPVPGVSSRHARQTARGVSEGSQDTGARQFRAHD